MTNCLSELYLNLRSLTVFRSVLHDPVVNSLVRLLSCEGSEAEKISLYADTVSGIYSCGTSFAAHIQNLVNYDENVYIKQIGMGVVPDNEIFAQVQRELEILEQLSSLTSKELKSVFSTKVALADFKTESIESISV